MSKRDNLKEINNEKLNVAGGAYSTTLFPARFMCTHCGKFWDGYCSSSTDEYKCPFCKHESGYGDRSILYDDRIDMKDFNPKKFK